MLGEVADEGLLYRLINPPSSKETLILQLQNYYPPPVVQAVLSMYTLPSATAPAIEWQNIFGTICGDCQVHYTIRGLTRSLLSPPDPADAMPVERVLRYRICWRAEALDKWVKPEVGVCHGADGPIWWGSGWRAGFTEEDKGKAVRFLEPFGKFLGGDGDKEVSDMWGTKGEREIREMGVDGVVRVVRDERWEGALRVWDVMWEAQREVRARI